MGKGTPIRPTYTKSIGAMLRLEIPCRAMCDTCDGWREVDLAALVDAIGADYSLWGRRTRCRIELACQGWNRFYFGGRGRFEPMRD